MSTLPRRPLPRPSLLSMAIAGVLLAPVARGATITVNSTADDGSGGCTLREAITSINSGALADGCTNSGPGFGTSDTILFDATVTGTITLNGTELQINKSVTIEGPGAGQLAVDGNASSRVFNISSGPVTIDGLTIQNGSTSTDGGGIRLSEASSVTLINSTVSGNSADRGGGIFVFKPFLTLTNSTVSGNYATSNGGGIFATSFGSVTLTNSTVSGNSAHYGGGGILVDRPFLTLTNSTVSGNSVRGSGGGIRLFQGSSVTLTNSTVSGNSAGGAGGGIETLFGSDVTLTNSTVSGNSAGDRGGGIFAELKSSMTLTNSTVSGNSAGTSFGGIFANKDAGVTLINSILSDNVGGDCFSGSPVTGSYNLIKDATNACSLTDGANNNIIGSDPLLAPLADNGCVTKAGDPSGPAEFYACVQTHALRTSSPALDKASATYAPATDQRGVSRPQGLADDIGAYELRSSGPRPVPALSLWTLLGGTGLMGLLGAWRVRRQARRRER